MFKTELRLDAMNNEIENLKHNNISLLADINRLKDINTILKARIIKTEDDIIIIKKKYDELSQKYEELLHPEFYCNDNCSDCLEYSESDCEPFPGTKHN